MKLSLNWLKEFTDIPAQKSARELAELLTIRTCEAEGYEDQREAFANIVVGKVTAIRPHPNANALRLIDTDIGGRIVQIVCGGQNLYEGMLVAVALPGSHVRWHGEGELVELSEAKIRGETSYGMICAGEEIGLEADNSKDSKEIRIKDVGAMLRQAQHDTTAKPGTPLADALGLNDVIFEIDNKSITNRPDLWGHYGMAREFSAFLGKKLKPFVAHSQLSKTGGGKKVRVEVANSSILKRFCSVILTGIHIAPSPLWMQNRLQALGIRPVNNIVDITNYVMLELGHPAHAFDRRTVKTDRFAVRFAKIGETLTTLDHKKRLLSPEDTLMTNGEDVLGIAGIMGGLDSEITPQTTEIIVEMACWNPVLIRKTAQRHALRTDAAQRFEKSLDPELTGIAFHRICELIFMLCPEAKAAGPVTDFYPAKAETRKPKIIPLDLASANRKIGDEISEKEAAAYLKALEFGVKKTKKGALKVEIPTFRATKDVAIEDDILEELARMHGYEKLTPQLPALPIRLPRENTERTREHKARKILSLGLGFTEVSLYSFYSTGDAKRALLPLNLHCQIENPLSEDQTHLRISLMPNLLKAAAPNLSHREKLSLYEIGRTYIRTNEAFPREEKFIDALVLRPAGGRNVFFDALGAAETLLARLGAKPQSVQTGTPPPYAHPKEFASIFIDGQEIAAVFTVHPQVIKNFGIDQPCAAFELNFSKFAALDRKEFIYEPLPRFPGITMDISVEVPSHRQAGPIQELIAHAGGELVKSALYLPEHDFALPEGKMALLFRVLLQSPDRTLTDAEMKDAQQKIFAALKEQGLTIRGARE